MEKLSVADAQALGARRYQMHGAMRVPAADPALVPHLAGMPVGSGALELMRAWLRGWDWAADKAARRAAYEAAHQPLSPMHASLSPFD